LNYTEGLSKADCPLTSRSYTQDTATSSIAITNETHTRLMSTNQRINPACHHTKQQRQCVCNEILKSVGSTIVIVEKQQVLHNLCVYL